MLAEYFIAEALSGPLRLNLGSGDTDLEGFVSIDRKHGTEVYPLDIEDGSAEEIRASHVLEHFSHRDVPDVLADWVRALKPGGVLRIAVPDFQVIAERYLAGAQLPVEGYVMGGHVDENDRHGSIFDVESLTELMHSAGLLGICRWESEIRDCASLPISLNLQGWKPPETWPKVSAVMSVPRLTFTDNHACAQRALAGLRIRLRLTQGAFWGQCLTRGIERAIKEDDAEYILTIDYDSIYTRQHIESLLSAALRHPEADCIAAIQSHRKECRALFTAVDDDGKPVAEVSRSTFAQELTRVSTAHFGLTLFRRSALDRCARPWFHGEPDASGSWNDGHIDDDVSFWKQWQSSGLSVYVANRVPIGHAELVVRWPDRNLGVLHQHPSDFEKDGPPEGVWR